ncbi:MAG: hypothetical protein H0Z33_07560 [Bacillaceae bacterium]|nr:hypothetical protein [Bacillaceae bacterium]
MSQTTLTRAEKLLLYGQMELKENFFGHYPKKQVDNFVRELIQEINKLEEENRRLNRELGKAPGRN